MTVPGRGDLSPPHRRSPIGRWLVTVVVLALLVGGGYAAFLGLTGSSSSSDQPAGKLVVCGKVAVQGPANPGTVNVVVLNGTLHGGLAGQVAVVLRHRGFHVSSIGNTTRLMTGVAAIRFPAGRLREAQAVQDQIAGATISQGHGTRLELALGPQFTALLSPAKAKAARHRLIASEGSKASPTPAATCSAPS